MQKKHILVGITGGIAAYKAVELCRRLKERDYDVRVVMTASAKEFITPLTLQAVSGNPVHHELFDEAAEAAMGHIELARWADLIVVAPATANFIAKVANGMANDLLTTLCIASPAPLLIAPAMNQQMWKAEATQTNITTLKQRGVTLVGPGVGDQACGDVGPGRMVEPSDILEEVCCPRGDQLKGQHWLITAGPTREQIDPVRFLSNNSSGKMGYAIAKAAQRLGAKVTVVSGPVAIEPPAGVERVCIKSAAEMLESVMNHVAFADVFVACAAVADYRPEKIVEQKIKKQKDAMQLSLVKNPDILQQVAAQPEKPFCVGFAAETEKLEHYAKDKLKRKNLDMICANNVADHSIGFDADRNAIDIFYRDGSHQQVNKDHKESIAHTLVQAIDEQRLKLTRSS